ncbi:UNVERIFIED_CONTAM: hypothetical protein GTU68_010908 [Idotea baltica]|nr:hypothetical protein [Idotea baltica]
MQKLQRAHVAVVGIGGVGSWVVEALARSGVGELSIFDFDVICITNINRQSHALTHTVHQTKTQALSERIQQINPKCIVHSAFDCIGKETVAQCITQDLDIVVDCIDSVFSKSALISWCKRQKIPVVSTGGAGGKKDPTKIKIVDLNKVYNDSLISKVRSLLRRDYGFSRQKNSHYSVPCVFSSEQLSRIDLNLAERNIINLENIPKHKPGTVITVTAGFGMAAAAKVIEKITIED